MTAARANIQKERLERMLQMPADVTDLPTQKPTWSSSSSWYDFVVVSNNTLAGLLLLFTEQYEPNTIEEQVIGRSDRLYPQASEASAPNSCFWKPANRGH
jgi:hypothetical protein